MNNLNNQDLQTQLQALGLKVRKVLSALNSLKKKAAEMEEKDATVARIEKEIRAEREARFEAEAKIEEWKASGRVAELENQIAQVLAECDELRRNGELRHSLYPTP